VPEAGFKVNAKPLKSKMKLAHKIALLQHLQDYIGSDPESWTDVKAEATRMNAWFLPAFVELALDNIRQQFLAPGLLERFSGDYSMPGEPTDPKTIGLVMAGNIPLVGFHDFLCIFLSGHRQLIKASSKDDVLIKHILEWMYRQEPETRSLASLSPMLKNCDAYIATGSDNSARYFEQYFAKYPHIIRRNRTSVAILDGTETWEELALLADDIQLYFGLGCRNVTQVHVPGGYDFVPLLDALKKYDYFMEHHKYKHNFDYNLTIQIMNNRFYMTNGSVLLTENESPFSPIGQVNYQFYSDRDKLSASFDPEKIQCIVGRGHLPFGQAQRPSLRDYADGVDVMEFLKKL
jgi:Acyl-CoA reductase (LuxC)